MVFESRKPLVLDEDGVIITAILVGIGAGYAAKRIVKAKGGTNFNQGLAFVLAYFIIGWGTRQLTIKRLYRFREEECRKGNMTGWRCTGKIEIQPNT